MPDYKERYLELFNGITDAIESLKKLQKEVEEKIISDESDDEN